MIIIDQQLLKPTTTSETDIMYSKIAFTSSEHGNTTPLIVETEKLNTMTLGQISNLYPYSEAMKMKRYLRTDGFATWDDAFHADFDFNR